MKKVKNNNNAFPKKKLNRIQITDNNENNTFNNINKKISETMNNTENISLVDDIDNKTCSQTKNDLSNDLNGEYYGFYDFSKKYNNEINIENLNIDNDNDDFTEKINESSSGQTHLTGETILKKIIIQIIIIIYSYQILPQII